MSIIVLNVHSFWQFVWQHEPNLFYRFFFAICSFFSSLISRCTHTFSIKKRIIINTKGQKKVLSLSQLRLIWPFKCTTKCDFGIWYSQVCKCMCVCVSLYCFVRKTKRKTLTKKIIDKIGSLKRRRRGSQKNPRANRECVFFYYFHSFVIVLDHAICCSGRFFLSLVKLRINRITWPLWCPQL